MSIANTLPGDLLELLVLYTSGAANDGQFERLEELLDRSEEARLYYVKALDIHASLYWYRPQHVADMAVLREGVGQSGSEFPSCESSLTAFLTPSSKSRMSPVGDSISSAGPACPTPTFLSTAIHGTISFFSQELPFSLLIATVLTSLGLWAASMVYVSSPEKIAKDSLLPTKTSFDPTLNVVGKITGMGDCKWTDPRTETFIGANVLFGRMYMLASGLMEITYNTGAKVILQGPVTYRVDANGGYLTLGKLTGKLEKKGPEKVVSGQWPVASETNPQSLILNPFVIKTPTATVMDLGTEFGVEVDAQKATTSHVFCGAVQLQPTAQDGQAKGVAQILRANQSARVECVNQSGGKLGVVLVPPISRSDFIRDIPRRTERPALLNDDFNSSSLDTMKWLTNTTIPAPLSLPLSAVQRRGHVELTNAGCLVTVGQFNPKRWGGIKICGRWTFCHMESVGNAGCYDRMHVTTRTTGDLTAIPTGAIVMNDGVIFHFGNDGLAGICTRGLADSLTNLVQTGRAVVREGYTFQFCVVDDGVGKLSISVSQLGDPSNCASATAALVDAPHNHDHVAFHNAWWQDPQKSNNIAYLDDVEIRAIGKPLNGRP